MQPSAPREGARRDGEGGFSSGQAVGGVVFDTQQNKICIFKLIAVSVVSLQAHTPLDPNLVLLMHSYSV